jgi:hypothetical protein
MTIFVASKCRFARSVFPSLHRSALSLDFGSRLLREAGIHSPSSRPKQPRLTRYRLFVKARFWPPKNLPESLAYRSSENRLAPASPSKIEGSEAEGRAPRVSALAGCGKRANVMLSAAKCRSLLEDFALIGTKHLLFLIENKQKADPFATLRASSSLRSVESNQPCHSEERSDEESAFCREEQKKQSRFLAEFTLSSFASLRTVRNGANGLGMTGRGDFHP